MFVLQEYLRQALLENLTPKVVEMKMLLFISVYVLIQLPIQYMNFWMKIWKLFR